MMACVEKSLHEVEVVMDNKSCVVVIISSKGYPGGYAQGDKITMELLDEAGGVLLLPAFGFC
jgi:phosphoribosylamine-glycine ligase